MLRAEWGPALRDGIRRATARAGGDLPGDDDIACAFYGDLFRAPGRTLGVGDPWLDPEDMNEFEADLLAKWWRAAAAADASVIGPGARTLARVPNAVQAALRALSGSRFFADVAERALLFDLRQVSSYMTDPGIRQAILDRVVEVVDEGPHVMVAHSLGAVVAYEALCAHPEWPVRTLVTLGAPLGIRGLIFDRLQPSPELLDAGGALGRWPGAVRTWTNVADTGDVVALVKDLRPLFGPRVGCFVVDNGARAHDVRRYLNVRETGTAVAAALAHSGDAP